MPISHSGLRGAPCGGERQDLRSEEGTLRDKLHGAVPVRPRLHPTARAHDPMPAQRAVGGAADILPKPYVWVLYPRVRDDGPLPLEGAGNAGHHLGVQDSSEPGRRAHHGPRDFLEVSPVMGPWELTSSGVGVEPGLQDCPGDPPRQSRGSSSRKGQKGAYQWPRLLREGKVNGS